MASSPEHRGLTCVVDEQIQPGLGPQEVISEGANGLQTGQVELHEDHLAVTCLLRTRTTKKHSTLTGRFQSLSGLPDFYCVGRCLSCFCCF